MHDGLAGQRRSIVVWPTAAQAGDALGGDTIGFDRGRSGRHDHREGAVEFVPPLDDYRLSTLGLDRRAGQAAVEAPDR
jgi:hypothetical protein